EMLEPGMIQDLPPGTEVKFATPPGVEGYPEVARISLQEIAAGLGVPYEVVTGDLSAVSFISGRLGRLNFKRSVETWQWLTFIPQFCEPAGQWFLDAAVMMGENVDNCVFKWTTPAVEMMDPASEVPAKVKEIRAGLTTLQEAIRERGLDPDAVLREYAATDALLDQYKMTLDSDPRRVTQVGNALDASTPGPQSPPSPAPKPKDPAK
ncbi:MAG: phage portal protein, partial [Janthinobacterium lividum]